MNEPLNPLIAVSGGILIGLSATLLLTLNGRIAGISGMVHGLLRATPDKAWRWLFLSGLLAGSLLFRLWQPQGFNPGATHPLLLIGISGILVGFGTRMGSGCTSGHGVCGIGRLSLRSTVATLVFMAMGIGTVYLLRHVFGGP